MIHPRNILLILLAVGAGAATRPVAAQSADDESPKLDYLTNSVGMKLVRIPAGSFVMGSPKREAERVDKENPHKVTITRSFFLGVYEVTQDQYSKVLPQERNRAVFDGPGQPMENVEWKLAKQFCEKLSALSEEKRAGRSYRLPTEAEWEYACRAGTKTAFHFGDSLSSKQANFNGNYPAGDAERGPYLRKTAKVGSYSPNAFGLYDMHGNVSEWCADWYDPEYYANSPAADPTGPPFGVVPTDFSKLFFVVVRGGNWVDDGRACRSAYRYRAMPETQYRLIGFRVACDVKENADSE